MFLYEASYLWMNISSIKSLRRWPLMTYNFTFVNYCKYMPQTNEMISATSVPKFTILWWHVEELLLLNKFFPIVNICLSREDIARQSCVMVPRWRYFACCIFSEACSTFQTCILISHEGHTMCGSIVDIQSLTTEITWWKKEERNNRAKI